MTTDRYEDRGLYNVAAGAQSHSLADDFNITSTDLEEFNTLSAHPHYIVHRCPLSDYLNVE